MALRDSAQGVLAERLQTTTKGQEDCLDKDKGVRKTSVNKRWAHKLKEGHSPAATRHYVGQPPLLF